MNNISVPIILTTISGLSTMLGALLIFIKVKNINNILAFSLMFSATIMLGISLTDLVPNAYNYFTKFYSIKFVVLVILIGSIITFILDGYMDYNMNNNNDNNLYKIGIFSMIAIIIHNLPEGVITFMSSYNNIVLGLSLTIAIACHNIPEGISLSLPIYYSTNSKSKALIYTFISGISEPIGGLLIFLIFKKILNEYILNFILLIVAGMMIYLSLVKLLPEAIKQKNVKNMLLAIFSGIIILLII